MASPHLPPAETVGRSDGTVPLPLDYATPPRSPARVPLSVRVGWGAGGLADNYIMNALTVLVLPIYNLALKMDPVLLGLAVAIPRLIDAITDPMMGNLSDNTRSRWGRRRPYIVGGAVACALLLPLLWAVPFSSQWGMFAYLLVMGTLYALAYTAFVIPYTALGYELTDDYDQRTRVQAWRMYIGLLGSFSVPWLYKLTLNPVFGGNDQLGAIVVSVVLGSIIVVTGVLPALACRERPAAQHQESIRLIPAIRHTLRNRPYLLLLVAYVLILFGLFSAGPLGLYVNIFVVCNGDRGMAASIGGVVGSATAIAAWIGLPFATAAAARFGKRETMVGCLSLGLLSALSLSITMDPRWPYMQVLSGILFGLGMQGAWLMVASMTGDACDEDELRTGLRREGLYSAVTAFALKSALALTAIGGGSMLSLSGYDANVDPSPDVAARLKLLFIILQASGLVLGIVLFFFYPITRERAQRTRRLLDERAAKATAAS